MKTLDIRRHAMRQKPGQHLSQDGLVLARQVGTALGPYSAVTTSHLARAIETAVAMGFAVDRTVEELGVYPETLPDMISWPAALDEIESRLSQHPELIGLAEAQAALWKRFLTEIPDGEGGLVVTHGGLLEIGTIALMSELRIPVDGDAFAYCEGIRIRANGTIIEAIEQIRLPETLRLVNN
uniref:Histidine phosphatase family protein n=1 Tax=Bosea sp. NBC_00436 TaxID=2969620 RepID=A0A9E8CN97_9HYPH